jgi:hypothetical protein
MRPKRSTNVDQFEARFLAFGTAAFTRLVLLVLIPSIIVVPSTARETDETARLSAVRSDYARGLAQLQTEFATFGGSGKYTDSRSPDQAERTYEVDFTRKPGSFKFITHDHVLLNNGNRSVSQDVAVCSNPLITVRLDRPSGAPAFYVSRTETSPIITGPTGPLPKFLDCAYSMAGYSLPDLLSDPDFVLDKAEEVTLKANTMVKIFFHRKPKLGPNPKSKVLQVLKDGWIITSPRDNWATQQYEFRLTHLTRLKGTALAEICGGLVEYGESSSGTRLPKRAVIKRFIRLDSENKKVLKLAPDVHDGDVMATETFDFQNVQFESQSDEAFTLVAFGLPELGAPVRHFRRDYAAVWYIVAALAFLVTAIALRRFVSRRSQRS